MQQVGLPGPPRHDVVDLERDADAEQQRQRDDVGEVERQADQHADFERHDAGEQQRHAASAARRRTGAARSRAGSRSTPARSRRPAGRLRSPCRPTAGSRSARRPRAGYWSSIARAKVRSVSVSFGSPLGDTETRARPSGSTHWLVRSGGRFVDRDRLGAQVIAQLGQIDAERHDEGILACARAPPDRRWRVASDRQQGGGPHRHPPTWRRRQAASASRPSRSMQRRSARRVGWRGAVLGLQHRSELAVERADRRELARLIVRHEVFERHGARDLRQLAQVLGGGVGVAQRRQHHADRVGVEAWVVAQVEEGRDRLDRRGCAD